MGLTMLLLFAAGNMTDVTSLFFLSPWPQEASAWSFGVPDSSRRPRIIVQPFVSATFKLCFHYTPDHIWPHTHIQKEWIPQYMYSNTRCIISWLQLRCRSAEDVAYQ